MDLDEGRRAAGFKTALCSAWTRTASRAPVWMRSWSHHRSLVPVILTVHAPAVASPLVVPRWHDLPSTCVPSRLEMWPNSARLASKWPYSLSRVPYIVLTHPAAKVHHRSWVEPRRRPHRSRGLPPVSLQQCTPPPPAAPHPLHGDR
jgi:hypothetical protein